MNKDIELNQKALAAVLEDLRSAELVAGYFFKEGHVDVSSLRVSWTQNGLHVVSSYARALKALGDLSERNIDVLNTLLARATLDLPASSAVEPDDHFT